MPCYDPGASSQAHYEEVKKFRDELNKVEAMLCAVVNVLVDNKLIIPVVEAIDTEEAGVTPNDIAIWWTTHVKKDLERKEREKKDDTRTADR